MYQHDTNEQLIKRFGPLANFQIWLRDHEPEDGMGWKDSWWDRNMFIRDKILDELFKQSEYQVIGSHFSKSIECPIVMFRYHGTEIVLQYNFYDWQIMVHSPKDLNLTNLATHHADGDYFFYQGIPAEYRFKQYDARENCRDFAIDVEDNCGRFDLCNVWGFLLELKRTIDSNF